MKPQRDIFDIFGDSARKMRVDPSSRAWKKLDRKMNRSRYGSQAKIYRLMAMAASIVLLLGVVTLMADKVKKRKTAMLQDNIELIELASNDDFEGYEAVFISYNDYKTKKITEGNEVVKFVVNGRVDLETETMIADVTKEINTKKQAAAKRKIVSPSAEKETTMTAEEIPELGLVTSDENEIENEVTVGMSTVDSRASEETGFVIVDEGNLEEDAVAATEEMREVRVKDAVESPTSARYKKRSSAKMERSGIDTVIENKLSQFEWLQGDWAEKRTNGQSIENWKQVDANTMVSTGKLYNGDKEIYSENMSISQRGNDVVFKISVGDNGLPVEYKFVAEKRNSFIFENNSQLLNQLILSKIGTDSIQVVLESTGKNEIPVKQQQFLNQRNAVLSNSAIRNMSRVKNKKG